MNTNRLTFLIPFLLIILSSCGSNSEPKKETTFYKKESIVHVFLFKVSESFGNENSLNQKHFLMHFLLLFLMCFGVALFE